MTMRDEGPVTARISAIERKGAYTVRGMTMILLMGAAFMTASCGYGPYDWNKALAANTVAAYESYLQAHPDGKHADDARGRVLALKDDQAWSASQKLNTIDAYQAYLRQEAGGVHAADAQYQLTALQRARDWQAIQPGNSASALEAFLKTYPQGPESSEARQRLSTLAYQVRLADVRSKAAAEHKREQLQARFGKVLHEVVVIAPANPNANYQVASEPMTEADAHKACAALEQAHQSCSLMQRPGSPG